MNNDPLSRIAQMAAHDGMPHADLLNPEVRSGSSFTFDPGAIGAVAWPRFQVVWFYTVDVAKRPAFAVAIAAYETTATLATTGVTYRGTYSVTISGAAPDLEYRTVWGLNALGDIQALNDALNASALTAPTDPLHAWLLLISPTPAMRSELMGRTVGSAPLYS